MNLCDTGHDEICYDSRHCPLCTMQEEYINKIKVIEVLEEKISEYEIIYKEIKIQYPEFCI